MHRDLETSIADWNRRLIVAVVNPMPANNRLHHDVWSCVDQSGSGNRRITGRSRLVVVDAVTGNRPCDPALSTNPGDGNRYGAAVVIRKDDLKFAGRII